MSLQLNALDLLGAKERLRQFLNDPVNWVAFINRYDMSKEEQRYWRDHFGLEHTFEGELEA
ncbi:hypothetical protein LZT09_13875 [Vibrio fluvialis]|uniref:hypothetical protein n=1 Tax=Vibrio fluvialis TaxID=676 RepID=UPI001F2A0B6D|nr:hypothetical protein [Vibrio fluvialis]MCE7615717.1 hypothetical protein [Vibrio fluvialis]